MALREHHGRGRVFDDLAVLLRERERADASLEFSINGLHPVGCVDWRSGSVGAIVVGGDEEFGIFEAGVGGQNEKVFGGAVANGEAADGEVGTVDENVAAGLVAAVAVGLVEIEVVGVIDADGDVEAGVWIKGLEAVEAFGDLAVAFAELGSEVSTGSKNRVAGEKGGGRVGARGGVDLQSHLVFKRDEEEPGGWRRKVGGFEGGAESLAGAGADLGKALGQREWTSDGSGRALTIPKMDRDHPERGEAKERRDESFPQELGFRIRKTGEQLGDAHRALIGGIPLLLEFDVFVDLWSPVVETPHVIEDILRWARREGEGCRDLAGDAVVGDAGFAQGAGVGRIPVTFIIVLDGDNVPRDDALGVIENRPDPERYEEDGKENENF